MIKNSIIKIMKKSLILFMLGLLLISSKGYCQPEVSLIGNGYIQVEYGCITNWTYYDIDMPVFKINNLVHDMVYVPHKDVSTIFDNTNYESWPYPDSMEVIGSHWKWLRSTESTDTIVLSFYGDYENLDINTSEWLTFGLDTWPLPGSGDSKNVNVSIIPPNPDMSISGESMVCSNPVSFDLLNMPTSYTSATWVIKQGTVTRASGNGTTASANNLLNGSAEVIFTIHFTCGLKDLTYKKDFWFGPPLLDYITAESGSCGYTGQSSSFAVWPSNSHISNPEPVWYVYPYANIWYNQDSYAQIEWAYADTYEISAYASNTCGSSNTVYYSDFYVYDSFFSISPNPASNEVTITINKSQSLNAITNAGNDPDYNVSILDMVGNLKSQKKYSGNIFTIPISKLKDGNYLVRISNGKSISTKQLIIKH
jgi:hypothetical protein